MSTARKSLIVRKATPVSEASDLREGMDNIAAAGHAVARSFDTLARALCVLAVKHEARNPGEQRELGAILWTDVLSDFHDVPTTEEMRTWLAGLLKIDPKAFPKRPYGR